MKTTDNTKKERCCKSFKWDMEVTEYLQTHSNYKIIHVAASDNFLWIIFEYEKET